MTSRQDLEQLSTRELHHKAMDRARKHFDVAFVWELVRTVPVAEAAAGHVGESRSDVVSLTALLTDVFYANEPEVAEQLRPLYLDYLERRR
jgi:hypothetical protein